ncbi:hypothetical protein [uncultured Micrococcus sp.]|uniref:hypothetical protein n=1 Tax=uncultured Micrococcus sp. TaxID=114051 RepID=UPI0025DA61C6|nr:hypothetical protein [uncultured Micrococcus sp.]
MPDSSAKPPSARERFLARVRANPINLQDETPEEARISLVEASRRSQLDFARQFDPSAALEEEVQLRLVGDGADHGQLPVEWSALAPRFQDALSEFCTAKGSLRLRLAGVSSGSTVMHFVPEREEPMDATSADTVVVDQTALGDAAERLAAVLDSVAGGHDLRQWSSHLHEVERLATELSKHELHADVTYLGRAGRVVRAYMNDAVLTRLASLQETHEEEAPRTVQGRIIQLAENGHVRVKTGTAKTSPVHEVRVSDKQKLAGLRIGQQVHWAVMAVRSVDVLGRGKDERLDYVAEQASTLSTEPLLDVQGA